METVVTKIEKSFATRLNERVFAGTYGKVPEIHTSGTYRRIGSIGFNGEKNFGEFGPAKSYFPDYWTLRTRSWQLYLESEVAQTVINNHIKWVIGSGLKLQSEPVKDVLESEGIQMNVEKFTRSIEARFKIYSKSRISDYSDMSNLNSMEADAFKNAIIGGDVLVILRYNNDEQAVKVELIDGEHVQSPIYGSELMPMELPNGHRIVNGIEIDEKKTHIAYYVRKDYRTLSWTRIPARGQDTNALMAFMVYGTKYRLDNHRGLPILSVMFETIKKLDRYKDATVASAEERAKISLAIEHDIFSTGENPFLKQTVQARGDGFPFSDNVVPRDDFGTALADKISVSTGRETWNLPLGAHLKALESKNELYFKDFYTTNIMIFCAAAGIPYEVAMAKYDSNYSASRGAMKQWEHVLGVLRTQFSFQFMQPIYDFFLEVQVMTSKVKAPGYLRARLKNDRMLMEAFRNARFVGPAVPHVDPMKEVQAERLKLGTNGAHLPLTTLEQATENLNGGDSEANMEQFSEEYKTGEKLGIKVPEPAVKPGAAKPGAK